MTRRGRPTVGVEEEFTLVDPHTGHVLPCAAAVVDACADPAGVVVESMQYMVETRTPVCSTLDEVRAYLLSHRRRLADEAERLGASVVASGVPPFGFPAPPLVTPLPRYEQLARQFPRAMSTSGTCGCHVHVGVPDRQVGARVLLHVRRWLPALAALMANSPVAAGIDTGRASERLLLQGRWPTALPAAPVGTAVAYDALVRDAVARGDALDARSVYFLARLSPRYPTVEVRVADVALTVEETVGYAGLVRALVAKAVDEEDCGGAVDEGDQDVLTQACRRAAETGLAGDLLDPLTATAAPAWDLVDELVAQVADHLRRSGDEETVRAALEPMRALGGGAERQRRLFQPAHARAPFVAALAPCSTARDLGDPVRG